MNTEFLTASLDGSSQLLPAIIETPYGRVEYIDAGQGPAVLTLHGAMGGCDQSLLLARTIGAHGYRYLAVSRPGYLGTPLASGKSPQQQADLCAALLDALDIPDALLMAVSGGGPCALYFALRHPLRCRGLVLVSTCGEVMDTPIPFAFRLSMRLARFAPVAAAMEKKASENIEQAAIRSIPDPALRAHTMKHPENGPLFRELLTSTSTQMAQRMPGTHNDIAVTRNTGYPLEQIMSPALIIHGTADTTVPYAQHATALATRIPRAELLTLDDGEHVAIFTHREQVLPRVAQFLRQHATAD